MKPKPPKQPDENRYQIKRLAKKKYRITETATGRSAITDDPTPFRPTQQVRVIGIPNKGIDLDKLARALLMVANDIKREVEEKKEPPKAA